MNKNLIEVSYQEHLKAYLASKDTLFHTVKKRDGRLVPFNPTAITKSLIAAGKSSGEFDEDIARKLTIRVIEQATNIITDPTPSVEDIQDVAEEVLLQSPFRKTAREFIIYREQHARMRQIASEADVSKVDSYISKLDWAVRENSNMSYSLQGLNNYLSSAVSREYWLNKVYPHVIREAHEEGDFHIHDLNQVSVYCVGWDLLDLLKEGFKGATGKMEANAPRHFRSALGQITNFFYTLQGEAAGAQAFSNFDTLLAPFIRYDNLDREQVKQCIQEFVFNINVPTRVGFQTPFTNVTLDLICPEHYRMHPVIRGGEMQPDTYGDFQEEINLFNSAFFEVMAEGDAKGRIMTFPIPTINLTNDFDWENPNLDGLWEMTGKYGVPYFSNFINSDMDPSDARSMCCRLRIDNTELDKRGGGLFGAHPLTGSVGVVTINLPRLAYRAKSKEEFQSKLAQMMDLAKDSLEIKRKLLERLTDSQLYPYTVYYLRGMKERNGRYWDNHFSTIGLLGMNEASLNLIGKDIGEGDGQAFAAETLDFMRERLIQYQEETGNRYNLEATPGESTTYRFALKDQEKCPNIRFANNQDVIDGKAQPYYTNSSHLPVNYTDDLFDALDLQDDLQTKYTGGTVVHLFLGERISNHRIVRNLVRKIAENYHLPYFSLTPTFSVCPEHGYLEGEQHTCEHCGKETEVYSRVVGYLRPIQQWNPGKQAEFGDRSTLGFSVEEKEEANVQTEKVEKKQETA